MKFATITTFDPRLDTIAQSGLKIPATPEAGFGFGIEFGRAVKHIATGSSQPGREVLVYGEEPVWTGVRIDAEATPEQVAEALEKLAADLRSGAFRATGNETRLGREHDLRSNKDEWPMGQFRECVEPEQPA